MNVERKLPRIAKSILKQIPPDWELLLVVFPRQAGGRGFHITSIPEDQTVRILKELIEEIENTPSPRH